MSVRLKILFLIIIIGFFGCDIFEVREPESPTDTRSGYTVPVQPSDVIQNLITSFSERNADDYRKNFSEGPPLVNREFVFIPSGNVLSSFPQDWSIDEEFQYFNNLITRSPQDVPINLSFLGGQYDIQADSAIFSAEYSISLPVQNNEPKIYRGNLKFTMVRNQTWVIYLWEDLAISESTSWSELKIEFY